MIFVDTNVFMYAVGKPHPLREPARELFERSMQDERARLCTSAEVLQELLHAYVPVRRLSTLDAAFELVRATVAEVWPVEEEDVELARKLVEAHPSLGARDLLHLACCRRRRVRRVMTYDRALESAFTK